MYPRFYFIALIFLMFSGPIFAKKHHQRPHWEEIIPNITKEFVPEETQQIIEEIFPSTDKTLLKDKMQSGKTKDYYGKKKFKGELLASIHIHGPGTLQEARSKEKIEIDEAAIIENCNISSLIANSSLEAKESSIQTLRVRGPALLKQCKILQKATFESDLIAKKTTFQGPLRVNGASLIFKTCECQDIVVSSSYPSKITLENTRVKGKITFEGKPGTVVVKENSQIKGKIKNGAIFTE